MPRKRSNKAFKNSVKIILLASIILIVLAGIFGFVFYQSSLSPKDANSSESITLEIPHGANRNQIATILEENQVIESSQAFKTYVRLNSAQGFQAGIYEMTPAMSIPDIVENLQVGGTAIGDAAIGRITIREGITLVEIAETFAEKTSYSKEEFMDLIENPEFVQAKIAEFPQLLDDVAQVEETRYTLEGYLYPATYDIYENTSLESLVTQMISQMDQVLQPYYQDIEESELDVNQTVTLASMIEGEAISDADRKLVSGIFHNRLDLDMPLQTDVSVIYAVGEHLERVLYEHLEEDSPYNLYMYAGLSPGPVVNPSAISIDAAINPKDTDYLYFLTDLETGEFYYSDDYETHLEHQNEYLRKNYFGD